MIKFFKTFYGKLSAIFLLLLVTVGAVQIYLTFNASIRYLNEVDQKLNLHLAQNFATELRPLVKDSLSVPAIGQTIHYMMVMNPKIEIYLANHQGKILAFFADPPQKVKTTHINLKPVHQFIEEQKKPLLLGEDPRHPGTMKPFSAAPLKIGSNDNGYVYIILNSERYDTALNMLRNSYIMRTSLKILLIVILVTGIIGLILFAFMTRRLRKVSQAVKAFDNGELDRRVVLHSSDEIGELANSFNSMANTIVSSLDKLKQNDKLRRELVANISHDLRSPLASIQGYLETIMLKEKHLSDEERRQYLETIFRNTQQLGTLIADLFELSKLDARQIEPHPEPFSIAELAQDVVMKLQPAAKKKQIDMRVNPQGAIPMVYGDIALIERAMTNLIDNAIRYTPVQGNVTVHVSEANAGAEVTVEDNGPGVASEELPLLFERFYRMEKSRNRNDGGSGLGLAIAKKVLDIQNIPISADSVLGQGTRFHFRISKWVRGINL